MNKSAKKEPTEQGEKTAAEQWDKDASLHLRLMRAQEMAEPVQKSGGKLGKDGGKGLPYSYMPHDAVVAEARKALIAHGILFVPHLQEMTQDGNLTKAVVKGIFTNVDRPQETLELLGVGYGVDGSDKGPGKALSYAKKYILIHALLLNSGDDVEKDDIPHIPSRNTRLDQPRNAYAQAKGDYADPYTRANGAAAEPSEVLSSYEKALDNTHTKAGWQHVNGQHKTAVAGLDADSKKVARELAQKALDRINAAAPAAAE